MQPYINLLSDKLHYTGVTIDNPHHVSLPRGINVVIGANGSGKSSLGEIIEKGWNFRTNRVTASTEAKPSIKKIEFADIHTLSGMKVEYYQQRYEATMNDEVPTVAEALPDVVDTQRWRELKAMFRLRDIEDSKINFLSSGELRKLLIINAIISHVDILILDNPYIGLDSQSRSVLNEAIDAMAGAGITVVMLIANPDDIHPNARFILPMKQLRLLEPIEVEGNLKSVKQRLGSLFDYAVDCSAIPLPPTRDIEPIRSILRLEACEVKYGSRTIIPCIDWEVADGQFWALAGRNGSGKSTLLSLICADNPQAYSNHITLFDRRRGSGESIWDIKRRIAFISPEMSLHFHPAGSVATIIAQGLNDTTGIFIPLKPGQLELAWQWMRLLHIEHLADRSFGTLSAGERQMVMLARTFIKQPRLMILDEPLHGLDYARSRAVRAIINHMAARATAHPDMYPMAIIFVSHYLSERPECITFTKTL